MPIGCWLSAVRLFGKKMKRENCSYDCLYKWWWWCSGQPAGETRYHGDSVGWLWGGSADSSWSHSPQPVPHRLTGSLEPWESRQWRSRVPLWPMGIGLRPHSHAWRQPPLDRAIPRCGHPEFHRKLCLCWSLVWNLQTGCLLKLGD